MSKKKLIFLSLLLFVSFCTFSQTGTEVDLEILNNDLKPISNVEVKLKEQSSSETMKAQTNAAGKVHFNITAGRRWDVYVQGYRYEKQVIIIPEKENSVSSRTILITHDTVFNNRLRQQTFDRKQFQSIITDQSQVPVRPLPGNCLIWLDLVNSTGQKLAGKTVSIVDLQQHILYTAKTNAKGTVIFHVPGKKQYDIDVEEQLNASLMDVDNSKGIAYSEEIVYDAYEMEETKLNDTVTQAITFPVEQKKSRACYTIRISREDGEISNENVFLDDIQSKTVYHSKTDENGEVVFILPFGKKFMLHFNYQRDVDVIDLTDARQEANGYREITYTPDPALEHPEMFIPSREKLFLTDFEYYHVTPYPKPKDMYKPGVFLRWGNPTVNAERKEAVLELGLTTNYLTVNKRLPLNMSFVIDKSGSMAGYERIEGLKEGFTQLIQKLQPDDIISILLYNDGMELLLPAQQIGNNKNKIISLVQKIVPSGGTDMLKAMQAGYEQVLKHFSKDAINAVILLTDGYDMNSADTIIKTQQPYNGRICCTGIGVGKNYNYELMKQLVTKGGGLFNFAGEGKALVDIFSNGIIRHATPVAKDITIEIKYNRGLICNKVYGLQEPQIRNNRLTAGLPAMMSVTEKPMLINFEYKAGDMNATDEPVTVTLRFTNAGTGKREMITEQIQLQKGAGNTVKDLSLVINEEQKKMYAVASANDCLLKMTDAYAAADFIAAKEQLNRGLAKIKSLYGIAKDTDIISLVKKMELYLLALNNLEYKKKVEKF